MLLAGVVGELLRVCKLGIPGGVGVMCVFAIKRSPEVPPIPGSDSSKKYLHITNQFSHRNKALIYL